MQIATQILVAVALLAAVHYGLLASLLAGMLVYELVHALAPGHENRFVQRRTGKIIVVTMLAVLVIAAIGAAILGVVSLLASGPENLSVLVQKMAEVIETARSRFPPWVLSSFPDEPEELKTAAAAWLRDHAGQLRSTGQNLWRGLMHVLFGMVIGGMVAVSREAGDIERGPLAAALGERARLWGGFPKRRIRTGANCGAKCRSHGCLFDGSGWCDHRHSRPIQQKPSQRRDTDHRPSARGRESDCQRRDYARQSQRVTCAGGDLACVLDRYSQARVLRQRASHEWSGCPRRR